MGMRHRKKRRARQADVRRVPGGSKVEGLCRKGTTRPARPTARERTLLDAWDNAGGTGNTVIWKGGRTQVRKMAPTGDKPLHEVFPHTRRVRNLVTCKDGKYTVTQVTTYPAGTVNGECTSVGDVQAGEDRPERWTDHGKHVDGGWQAGARFNTEKMAFSRDVDRGKQ